MGKYSANDSQAKQGRGLAKKLFIFVVIIVVLTGGFLLWKNINKGDSNSTEKIASKINFDSGFAESEKALILSSISEQAIELSSDINAGVESKSVLVDTTAKHVMEAYVPVTAFNSAVQKVTFAELPLMKIGFLQNTEQVIIDSLAEKLGLSGELLSIGTIADIEEDEVVFVPIAELTGDVKLLALDDKYYLDTFDSGALFRVASFDSGGVSSLSGLNLNSLSSKKDVFKVNMTGVTALTREMMKPLQTKGAAFFSAKIGDFLADADLTHVSNEVSFKDLCAYSRTLFCSPPEFIETLKASGVDLVELTGNHNNDLGSEYNVSTIEMYKSLGWATVGGGINSAEAAKPHLSDMKNSKIAFLAYNFPDSPSGGAISGEQKAGANSFDFASIESDIIVAKASSQFIIVNVQYWECYAYPDGGYVEFPICDKPIGEQEANFKKLVDLGADMVIGSSAHQPQTYELYKGKAIYYGLGNLYFEQTQWPGTERSIVLTHYFAEGKLLQTKLTPTVYGDDFQTRLMTDTEADYILGRLRDAR